MILHRIAMLLLIVLTCATAASASDDRVVIDDLGRRVIVPLAAMRVVSLDDVSLTVPLLELGVVPVGSEGRLDENGRQFIRSAQIITGLDFGNTEMAFLGRNPVDVETLIALKPDLIVTLKSRPTPVEQLQAIAPTVVIDDIKRSSAQIYRLVADLTGTQARLGVLENRYAAQMGLLKRIASVYGPILVSVITATEDGKIDVEHTYGSLGAVLREAGFRFPPLTDGLAANSGLSFSPEALPEFDADVIFDTYRNDKNETALDARARMAAILPNYCKFLRACREGRYYIVPRDEAKSITYAGRMMAIAMVTAAVSTLPPRPDK